MQILIVEDSKHMQAALTDLFRTLGEDQKVTVTGRESEAIEWLEEHKEDWTLATVDLLIDEGSGFNFINRAKKTPNPGHVIVLSSFVSPVIKEKCLAFGADAVFMKSEVKEFADYVQSILKA